MNEYNAICLNTGRNFNCAVARGAYADYIEDRFSEIGGESAAKLIQLYIDNPEPDEKQVFEIYGNACMFYHGILLLFCPKLKIEPFTVHKHLISSFILTTYGSAVSKRISILVKDVYADIGLEYKYGIPRTVMYYTKELYDIGFRLTDLYEVLPLGGFGQ